MADHDSTALGWLDAHYAGVERRFNVVPDPTWGPLVTPTGNSTQRVHRWFHIKEAFSHALLGRLISDLDLSGKALNIADPFSGSGTTLTSAGELVREGNLHRVSVRSFEVNPFLHLLSRMKAESFVSPLPETLASARRVVALLASDRSLDLEPPDLSTFQNPDYFTRQNMDALLRISAGISEIRTSVDEGTYRTLQLCLAAAIEPSSSLRRDGRALRYVPEKKTARPADVFISKAEEIHIDWQNVPNVSISLEYGDVRQSNFGLIENEDLVVFSPPYPNNIDYTEVYKMEAWGLGLIESPSDFSALRHRTIRSHPSVKFAPDYDYVKSECVREMDQIISPIVEAIPDSRYAVQLRRTIIGYIDDMWKIISKSASALRPGGYLVYIVGNSAHGGRAQSGDHFVFAADLVLAEVCELAGLEVEEILVARRPSRRRSESHYLRESVVIARKPPAAL